jgi:hypothetical protein
VDASLSFLMRSTWVCQVRQSDLKYRKMRCWDCSEKKL